MKTTTSKTTRDNRIRYITELIANGCMRHEIVSICSKKWKISTPTIDRYLKIVYDFLKTDLNNEDREKILLEYTTLIERYEKKDPKLAKEYRFQRDKIMGISIERKDITSNGKTINIKYDET